MWTRVMPYEISNIVYLRTDLDECMRRLKLRHRDGECKITREYQEHLMKTHDDVLAEHSNVTIIESMHNYEENYQDTVLATDNLIKIIGM